jgi:hypothetical protein
MMATYEELCAIAIRKKYKLTPELKTDLRKMAGVSDAQLGEAYMKTVTERLARQFQVPIGAMESRLGLIPHKEKKR